MQFGSGGQVFSAAAIDMDFDTGTPTLNIPYAAAAEYFSQVSGSSNSTGHYTYDCNATLPDFDFIFSDVTKGPSTVTIPGSSIANSTDQAGGCSTFIAAVDGGGNAGIPFYISKYMIWHQAVPSLAFADQS